MVRRAKISHSERRFWDLEARGSLWLGFGLQPGGESILPMVLIDILLYDKEAENTAQNASRLHITMAQKYVTRGLSFDLFSSTRRCFLSYQCILLPRQCVVVIANNPL